MRIMGQLNQVNHSHNMDLFSSISLLGSMRSDSQYGGVLGVKSDDRNRTLSPPLFFLRLGSGSSRSSGDNFSRFFEHGSEVIYCLI